ncbi:uncharacterized protein LOC134193605 isoform X2 [Corticium candelabrum]|uniref:uncharacterized protein LOC134193605 isoform X2 n=1 Tax=Corticium candelabrum TaxID=121492 RepID=UPI002E25ACAB|nr:uncharacterized protein LOC134193605 isoform X2 [Corticium candelabrum]
MSSPSYFSGEGRKGEVNELRLLLRNPDVQRDSAKYRTVVQRVISYMTLGIDMSRLFTEMIMAAATNDLVRKKLVYLYMCNYAESHSDLALLVVNTLQKDCKDQDPTIRGLALRSMCYLRLVNLVEYIQRPLVAGLDDRSSYVRKTAVMGCVKMHYLAPSVIRDLGIIDKLYSLLEDKDPQVVCNCIVALDEMLAGQGGMLITQNIAHLLLSRLKEFTEWSQCLVLQLLTRYRPSNEEEIFDILNVLDDRLKHVNSGVVLAAAQLFLSLTMEMEELHEDINERMKTPLLTMLGLGSSSPELVYACLHHIQLLLHKQPRLLDSDFKSFFCRYNDPSYVKVKKLELLVDIATELNVQEIVEELSAYATDVNMEMSCKAIRAIGRIAVLHSSASDFCRMKLLALLSLEVDHVTTEVFIVMTDLVRKYSDASSDIVSHLASNVDIVTSPEGRAAIVWMLGEFGHELAEAPYLLESMIHEVADEKSSQIRLQLLTATVKLFFKRPPECQEMLGQLLKHCINEETDMDVHDRALLYYRLLRRGVAHAQRVVASPKEAVNLFAEDRVVEAKDRLLSEFNSLSVIYGQPSLNFVPQVPPYALGTDGLESESLYDRSPFLGSPSSSRSSKSEVQEAKTRKSFDSSVVPLGVISVPSSSLDPAVGDLLGFGLAPEETPPIIQLKENPQITPERFEQQWRSLPKSESLQLLLSVVPSPEELEQTMTTQRIATMASSPPNQRIAKFYFYAQQCVYAIG